MDNLDDLTNDQIRLKLVEHGLANIPVTTTTRKVQLKRLRAAIDGGAAATGGDKVTKNRRETIHVANKDPVEADAKIKTAASEKAKSGRRATISAAASASATASAIPIKTNTPSVVESAAAPSRVSSRRTSLRASVGSEPSEPAPATKFTSKVPSIVDVPEEMEVEDVPFIPISQKRTQRSSRSPSLSKSETVVTAFKQVLSRTTPIPEEIVTISDEDEDNRDNILNDFDTSGEQELAQFTTAYADFKPQTVERKQSSNVHRSSVGASFATTSTSYKPSAADDYKFSGGAQRRYTTTTSSWNQPPAEQRYRTPEKGAFGDGALPEVNTPYLSDFTRRLSKLRAEPLDEECRLLRRESAVGLDDDDYDAADGLYYRSISNVHGRQMIRLPVKAPDTFWTNAFALFLAAERKCRRVIWTMAGLLLAIFLLTVLLG